MDAGTLAIFGWNGSKCPTSIPLGSEEAVIDHTSSSHLSFSPKATDDQEESFIQVALSPDDCLVIHQNACHCFYRQKEEPGLLSHCMQRYREIHGEGNSLPQIVMIQCSKVKHPISLIFAVITLCMSQIYYHNLSNPFSVPIECGCFHR